MVSDMARGVRGLSRDAAALWLLDSGSCGVARKSQIPALRDRGRGSHSPVLAPLNAPTQRPEVRRDSHLPPRLNPRPGPSAHTRCAWLSYRLANAQRDSSRAPSCHRITRIPPSAQTAGGCTLSRLRPADWAARRPRSLAARLERVVEPSRRRWRRVLHGRPTPLDRERLSRRGPTWQHRYSCVTTRPTGSWYSGPRPGQSWPARWDAF